MPEPLKAIYHEEFLRQFGGLVQSAYPPFDSEAFVAAVLDDPWDELELKARLRRISATLGRFLPSRYEAALAVLFAIDEVCTGFPYLFFPDFVAVYGQDAADWELSVKALERFTPKSSAEFAVRPFLLRDPERMMAQMRRWAGHPDERVRRLASEGCRPRLPWGQTLPPFIADPAPVLAVLELLKADPALYVRKSVANNLNDIAKDHPDRVLETARRWQGEHPSTDWIIRQGCRNLVRKADPRALALFGYAEPAGPTELITSAALTVTPAVVPIGGKCALRYELRVRAGEPVRLRIEYGIDFVKASGRTSRKLFLAIDKIVPGGQLLAGVRTHSWADLTTRRHYPGHHRIVLSVNGKEVAETVLTLQG